MPYAASHETHAARRRLYDACIVLDWNITPRRRGRGSAIFFHLARPGFTPTQGCVAVTAQVMARLLPRLSRRTRAGRQALRAVCGLAGAAIASPASRTDQRVPLASTNSAICGRWTPMSRKSRSDRSMSSAIRAMRSRRWRVTMPAKAATVAGKRHALATPRWMVVSIGHGCPLLDKFFDVSRLSQTLPV